LKFEPSIARSILIALLSASLFSCGGGTRAGASGGSDGGSQVGADASSTAPTAATTGVGPIDVAASEEKTVCILKRLDNVEDIVATSFVTDLSAGSHHLIVYRSTATAEQTTPFACSPFQGLLTGDVPLVIVTRSHLDYALPPGVGVQLAKGQMLKIEAHYINATSAPIVGSATVSVNGSSVAEAGSFQAADVGLWGTTNINVPPRGTFSTPVNFQAGIAGTKVFALTTHEHQLGTEAQVWSSSKAGDVADSVTDDTDWANPALKTFAPAIPFDGTSGLSYQCKWSNTSDTAVAFGESALNEMCFVILYYYPSHGTDICLDGNCQGRTGTP
jgi:hypothetical protein